ncbi:MAG: hypothetical protein CMM52_01335 [Rhodospirillaceae bacterium]|nr:hypothetical protein [Rhodospirillaceae bacterium]|tara:strand:- start:622 stop:1299 length:678 start_codon:yes stop_codon:yes gene_type:complete
MKIRVILTVLSLQFLGLNASAGIISLTQHDIINEFDVANSGSLVVANSLGNVPISGTVNSVVFGGDQSGIGNMVNGSGNYSNQYGTATGLDRILSNAVLTENLDPGTLTLGGLTVGRTYRLQLLFSNTRNSIGDDQRISLLGSDIDIVDMGNRGINVVAEFTADTVSLLTSFTDPVNMAVLNAYALHDVTPASAPGTIAIFGLSVFGLGIARRRQDEAALKLRKS